MPVAVWSDQYETGIPELDAQHKRLFEAINHLADCFKEGQSSTGAREALVFLDEYTKDHFYTEEEFMRVVNYPGIEAHRKEHTDLLMKVQNLMLKMDEGYMITADVATFVADWLAHHINEVDMGYVLFTHDKLSRLS